MIVTPTQQTIVNGVLGLIHEGGQSARWKDEDMADTFQRSPRFCKRKKDQPFFLY